MTYTKLFTAASNLIRFLSQVFFDTTRIWDTQTISDQTIFIFLLLPALLPSWRIYNGDRAKLALHLQICQASKIIYLGVHRCIAFIAAACTACIPCIASACIGTVSVHSSSSSSRPLQQKFFCDKINAEKIFKTRSMQNIQKTRSMQRSDAKYSDLSLLTAGA